MNLMVDKLFDQLILFALVDISHRSMNFDRIWKGSHIELVFYHIQIYLLSLRIHFLEGMFCMLHNIKRPRYRCIGVVKYMKQVVNKFFDQLILFGLLDITHRSMMLRRIFRGNYKLVSIYHIQVCLV
jgi:hypothetical protein